MITGVISDNKKFNGMTTDLTKIFIDGNCYNCEVIEQSFVIGELLNENVCDTKATIYPINNKWYCIGNSLYTLNDDNEFVLEYTSPNELKRDCSNNFWFQSGNDNSMIFFGLSDAIIGYTVNNANYYDVSATNVGANDVLKNKIYVGQFGESKGTMPDNQAIEIIPSIEEQIIPKGYHNGKGKVLGDENLVPENIKEGVSIFNVEGTLKEGTLSNVDYEKALSLCDDIKGNPAPTEGHIYGVRKLLDGITLERTDDARGLTAEATHDGHPKEVTNNFDDLYPWSDIKSFMYDSSKEEIVAWYGDDEFTFTSEDTNINIFTRIPRFWYKRYKDEQYEYWKIADYAAEGFTEFAGCSPARYSISGSTSKPRSVSGGTLLTTTSGNDYKTASKVLGSYNGLLDIWSVGAIQMLYLVEYANADSQLMLGNGVSSGSKIATGGCDSLGMKSGCMSNKTSSVIYRGFEDIFGNVFDLVDGINIIDRQCWVCEDWTKYNFENTEDYKQLSYTNATSDNYGKELGLDEKYPLVMLPTVVSSSAESFTKDYYYQGSGNKVMRLGGHYKYGDFCGLFFVSCEYVPSSSIAAFGARFLLHKIN